jgi:hypothetical protein
LAKVKLSASFRSYPFFVYLSLSQQHQSTSWLIFRLLLWFLTCLSGASLFILRIPVAFATEPVLIILSEIHPSPASGQEWIELYNAGLETISLAGWRFEDVLSSPSVIYTFPTPSDPNQDPVINPGQYLVIEMPSHKLNNTGDGVRLYTTANQLIDQMDYPSTPTGQSWHRHPLDSPTGANPPQTGPHGQWYRSDPTPGLGWLPPAPSPSPSPIPSPAPSPTPSPSASPSPTPSSQPSPSPSPQASPPTTSYPQLRLTTLMACPNTNEPEWIELYNPLTTSYTLTNWRLRNQNNTSRYLNGTLPPLGSGRITWGGHIMGNTGDSLQLETPDGQIIDTAEYDDCSSQRGEALSLSQGTWLAASLLPAISSPPSDSPNSDSNPTTTTRLSELLTDSKLDAKDVIANLLNQSTSAKLIKQIKTLHTSSKKLSSRENNSITPVSLSPQSLTQPFLSLNQPQPSLPRLLSAIIGGLCLMGGGLLLRYQPSDPN